MKLNIHRRRAAYALTECAERLIRVATVTNVTDREFSNECQRLAEILLAKAKLIKAEVEWPKEEGVME
mgnify:CR=1 FL=1